MQKKFKVAILGAGFTGLSAGLKLSEEGHEVTIFEKEGSVGGLAVGFKQELWEWSLEKAYHHWFTNDLSVLNLAKKINHKVIIKRPNTDVFVNNKIIPFDSLTSLLKFPYLSLADKIRTGGWLAYLKVTNDYKQFEGKKALGWIRKRMGEEVTKLIWEPLFEGKFKDFKEEISLTWFWARIKKRTPSLGYPEFGFKVFADNLADRIRKNNGKILLDTTVSSILSTPKGCEIKIGERKEYFDKVIVTLPSPIFIKLTKNLPDDYIQKINSIPHLHAQNLILVLKEPFLKKSYWLNITDQKFPFLVLAEHTNFMDPKHYGNQHVIYVGNYLPQDHPFLALDKKQLLKKFDPFLRQINLNYEDNLIDSHLFTALFAQPIVTTDYSKKIPEYQTPLSNVFIANMDMVYPWDRGTNYAVEMGEKVADLIK